MTYKDKGSYESSPPCTRLFTLIFTRTSSHTYTHTNANSQDSHTTAAERVHIHTHLSHTYEYTTLQLINTHLFTHGYTLLSANTYTHRFTGCAHDFLRERRETRAFRGRVSQAQSSNRLFARRGLLCVFSVLLDVCSSKGISPYIYIHIYICVCVYMSMYMYVYVYIYLYMYTHSFMWHISHIHMCDVCMVETTPLFVRVAHLNGITIDEWIYR